MEDFGKKQLLKYGWTEGKGLGKDENGTVEAYKPKPKYNNEGLGYSSNNSEWWETAFDKASNNIIVNNENNKVTFSVNKNTTNDKFTEVVSRFKQSRQIQYDNFRQLETVNCGESSSNENTHPKAAVLSDNDILRACKGKTRHKGSRHGITMSGKLERIHQHEKRLSHVIQTFNSPTVINRKSIWNEKAEKLQINHNNNTNITESIKDELPVQEHLQKNAVIKQNKKDMKQLISMLNNACNINDIKCCSSNVTESKQSTSHKHHDNSTVQTNETPSNDEIVTESNENNSNDSMNSDELLSDRNKEKQKKIKPDKTFIVRHSVTAEGNVFRMVPCPSELYDYYKLKQKCRKPGNNYDFSKAFPPASDMSRWQIPNVLHVLKEKKVYQFSKIKGKFQWTKKTGQQSDPAYRQVLKDFLRENIGDAHAYKHWNTSTLSKKLIDSMIKF